MPPGPETSANGEPSEPSAPPRRAHAANRRPSRLRRRLTRTGLALVLLIVILVGGGAGYYFYRSHQIGHEAAPSVVPTSGPTENILLIGSTSRCAASSIARYKAECAQGVTGVNSDVVLVAHLDARTNTVSLLSIPRDTFVPGARSGSALCGTTSPLTPGTCANKIDAALVEGPNQLINAIEQDFGIPINHFVDLNFATFTNVVNALGGIKMYFPDRLYDASSFLKVTTTGCQMLNGTEALALVRARHLYYFTKGQTPDYAAIQAVTTPTGPWYTPNSGGTYDGTGDLGRIVRVHLFLKALAQQVSARGLSNPITDNNLIGAVAPNLTVDSGLSTTDLARLALDFRHANFGAAPELTIPTVTDGVPYTYEGGNYGDVIFPSEPQDQQTIDQFLGSTPSGLRLAPSSISVSVVDGIGSATATSSLSSALGALGFKIVPTTTSDVVGPVAETTVLYGAGHLQQAERVLHELRGTVVLAKGAPAAGAAVSVIVGSDVSVATAPSRTGSSAPATTQPVTTTTNPDLGAPTSATSAIPPYDPRACPAAGK